MAPAYCILRVPPVLRALQANIEFRVLRDPKKEGRNRRGVIPPPERMKPPLPLLFSGSVGKDASAEEEAVNLQLLELLEALVRRRVGEGELRKTRVRALAVYGEQHVVSARRHA